MAGWRRRWISRATGQRLDGRGRSRKCTRAQDRRTDARARCCIACAATPRLPATERDALDRYGRAIGLCFQIVDDLLDVLGDPASDRQGCGLRCAPQQADVSRDRGRRRSPRDAPAELAERHRGARRLRAGGRRLARSSRPTSSSAAAEYIRPWSAYAVAAAPSRLSPWVTKSRTACSPRSRRQPISGPCLAMICVPCRTSSRQYLIQTVGPMGGHLAAGLGTVELDGRAALRLRHARTTG